MEQAWDVVVVGAGMAGLPVAIRAAERDARVLLVEAAGDVGGKLPQSAMQISAAGARLQRERGIDDSPDDHYREIRRINGGTGDPVLTRLAVDEAGATIDWLQDIGCTFGPEMPVMTYNHDLYRARRYFWPEGQGGAALAAFRRELGRQVARGRVTLRLNTEMTGFVRAADGRVTGIRMRGGDAEEAVAAKNVVLTAGGYVADKALSAQLVPQVRYYSSPLPISSGKALRLAMALGCKVDGGADYLVVAPAVLEDPADSNSARMVLQATPQLRPPWEIWVNTEGKRFFREDHPKPNHRRRAIMAQPDVKFFVVFDEGVLQNAPSPVSHLQGDGLRAAFDRHPSYFAALTLPALARKIGVDAAALGATVAAYNRAVEDFHDPDFGRDSLPRPLDKPPFYAIAGVGVGLPSPAGIAVDGELRALDTAGRVIPGLYACGEIIGYTRTMGAAYEAGMGNGPAVTLPRVLGERFLRW